MAQGSPKAVVCLWAYSQPSSGKHRADSGKKSLIPLSQRFASGRVSATAPSRADAEVVCSWQQKDGFLSKAISFQRIPSPGKNCEAWGSATAHQRDNVARVVTFVIAKGVLLQ